VVDGDIAAAAAAVQVGDKTNEIVSTAYSIGKALGLAARFHYKTILLAHEQIDGTGEDLVRQLKDRGLIDLTRLYTMTRANPTVVAMKYIGLPVDDFLAKPLPPAQLASLLALPRKTE
jgi:DNA-binding response OmpR family regulator